MSRAQVSVLIASCDAYSDLWEPAARLIDLEWPDCSFPIYLGSNKKVFKHSKIKTIAIGEDRSWCDSVYKMLLRIESDYVILLLEDFFLTERADNENILKLFNWVKTNKIDCCRLIENRFNKGMAIGTIGEIQLLEIERFTPYRICTQAAIWNKSYLMALLNSKYSAWYFEGANTRLVNYTKSKIVSVSGPVIFYKHAVERGKWIKQGMDNLERHDINVDYKIRGVYQKPTNDQKAKSQKIPGKLLSVLLFIKYIPDLIILKIKLYKVRKYGK